MRAARSAAKRPAAPARSSERTTWSGTAGAGFGAAGVVEAGLVAPVAGAVVPVDGVVVVVGGVCAPDEPLGVEALALPGRSDTGTLPAALGTSSWYCEAPEFPGGATCVSA